MNILSNKERLILVAWYILLIILIFIKVEVAAIVGLVTSLGICLWMAILIKIKGKSTGKRL